MQLYMDDAGIDLSDKRILHFGPEKWLMRAMSNNPDYEPADLYAPIAKFRMDITSIDRPDNHFDVIVVHHVLEHIDDDSKAMSELYRVLKPGGLGFLSVPINLSRKDTYENASITEDWERFWHFTGTDHKRFYGRDFSQKLEAVGFEVTPYRRAQSEEIRYGLAQDECIYIVKK